MKTSKRASKRDLTKNLQDKIRSGELKPNSQIFAKREFTITTHAQIRIQELGIKMPIEFSKLILVVGNDFHSKRFDTKIKKSNLSKDKKSVNTYWTDGTFVFVCRSKRAGNFVIVTVL